MWWARVKVSYGDDYGRWVPTGERNLDDAKAYIAWYYEGVSQARIAEWLRY